MRNAPKILDELRQTREQVRDNGARVVRCSRGRRHFPPGSGSVRASSAPAGPARGANEWIAPIKATVNSEPHAVGYRRFDVTGRPDLWLPVSPTGASGDKGVSRCRKLVTSVPSPRDGAASPRS